MLYSLTPNAQMCDSSIPVRASCLLIDLFILGGVLPSISAISFSVLYISVSISIMQRYHKQLGLAIIKYFSLFIIDY